MKRQDYKTPQSRVIETKLRARLLAGSSGQHKEEQQQSNNNVGLENYSRKTIQYW